MTTSLMEEDSEPHVEHEEEAVQEEEAEEEGEEITQNPFGFTFSNSVLKCFTKSISETEIVFSSGNTYSGEMSEGVLHGKGRYFWSDTGAVYTGTFCWGALTGEGRIEWPDGSYYEGTVINGVRHGRGLYYHPQPEEFYYEGEWANGLFEGKGICYYGPKGCQHRYEGEFVGGLREGEGKMYYGTGNTYTGKWKNNLRDGHGKFIWAETGSYYIGDFKEGKMDGRGEIVYAFSAATPSVQFVQANRYLGQFEDSQRSGRGIFYYANGAVYNGEWMDNKKNGNGVYTSRDGRVYHSEFQNGSIFEDGQLFVPTPSISLNFPLNGLLSNSESQDEVLSSLCNIYVRFLPRLRALYQTYSKIQWADDPTITAMRMVGMWRFLQDKGRILTEDFTLSDADKLINWGLEKPSSSIGGKKLVSGIQSDLLKSTYGFSVIQGLPMFHLITNRPLDDGPDPFATLFLYQLFESLVRLAHYILEEEFPDSLVLRVTRFLEGYIFVDDSEVENEYSQYRKDISTGEFDEAVTRYSDKLLRIYLDYSGYSYGCAPIQTQQLEEASRFDPNVDVTVREYQGLMTTRDLVLLLGERGFLRGEKMSVLKLLSFIRYESVAGKINEEEFRNFEEYFTVDMERKITFVEFVQSLSWVAHHLISFSWSEVMKFEYLVEHIENWEEPIGGIGEMEDMRGGDGVDGEKGEGEGFERGEEEE